jgi:hypothetical protein
MLKDNQVLYVRIERPKSSNEYVYITFVLKEWLWDKGERIVVSQEVVHVDYDHYNMTNEYMLFDRIMVLQHQLAHFIWKYFNGSVFNKEHLEHLEKTCPKCRHMKHKPGGCFNIQSDNDCDCTYDSEGQDA